MVALAAPLLLGLAHVAVVDSAAGPLARQARPLQGLPVRELRAVVGEDQPEHALERPLPDGRLQHVERGRHRARRPLGQKQAQLRAAAAQVEREDALPVGGAPDHRVHLAGGLALALRERRERREGALRAVRRRRGRRPPPRPVPHLAAQVHVGHAGVAPLYPAVDGGGGGPELGRAGVGYLRRRQAAGQVGPDLGGDGLELLLRAVHPAPGGGQLAVGQQLGAGRGVLAAERHRAVVAAPVAAVADVRPAAEPGAGALGHRLDPRPLARPARDGAVAPDLVGDARLGPPQVARHRAGRPVLVQPPLYRGPLGAVEPPVEPLPSLGHRNLLPLARRPFGAAVGGSIPNSAARVQLSFEKK